jgi:hypothetical protein
MDLERATLHALNGENPAKTTVKSHKVIYDPLLRRMTLSFSAMHPEDVCRNARR